MSTTNWAPEACALPTAELPLRVAEFDTLFAEQLESVTRLDPTTADLILYADAQSTAADLTRRETKCCSFFRVDLAPADSGRVRLRISVPPAQTAVLDALTARALEKSSRD
ncbi:hypothetical protein EV646_10264 [Kribbella antiqua]|uniref:Arsenate reductase n=1 Tax=Kribbella antiqua TaxID=2512217 RepID=A0A4R2IW53_9ACTN|nr:hypothetical protein [Kribbella antiqua]TCO49993.1 hypothetical protein EV646_10264 [Kribbella antiqua]